MVFGVCAEWISLGTGGYARFFTGVRHSKHGCGWQYGDYGGGGRGWRKRKRKRKMVP
jgi:hypothetical protein